MNRRRFLMLAAAAALPARARGAEWRGVAFGADVSLWLDGPGADAALRDLPPLLDRIEDTFSLYRDSELVRLNESGEGAPSAWMTRALALCDRLHILTGGAFDPTVQPLWRALADGGDAAAARALAGWHRVTLAPLRLGPGQAITLNGMAQGMAADIVRDWLAARGFRHALVNLGEHAALGGPFRLGIEDPAAGLVAQRILTGGALAVSAPMATTVGGQPHILHPAGLLPLWSSVAVQADSAAMADGLSTGAVFLDRRALRALRRTPGVRMVGATGADGGFVTL
jgi:thiamine biosynthesis lipoprotein